MYVIILILYNNKRQKLYYFFIQKNEIKNPEIVFYQRLDIPNNSQIKIDSTDKDFKDKLKGFYFVKYLKYETQL
jgi:hypothetical protein